GLIAVPMAVAAATAYACTAVATLTDSPGAALPGSTVTVNGAFFGTHSATDSTSAGPVEIRLGSLTGPVLATASPSGTDRSFSVQITIPADAVSGDTFIAATQQTASGTPVFGTPARQAFTVSAPAVATPPLFAPVTFTPPPASCVVPDVMGKSASAAEGMLVASHCGVGTITHPKSKPHTKKKTKHHYKLVVGSTGLGVGSTAANGTKVNLKLHWV
ncbi:MAG TPA: hypothetical protein VG294_10000, partial [Solirubrobacteraceae bacterium]|nr:hypothetical protein [Solirubrobacteraceae bacterium]